MLCKAVILYKALRALSIYRLYFRSALYHARGRARGDSQNDIDTIIESGLRRARSPTATPSNPHRHIASGRRLSPPLTPETSVLSARCTPPTSPLTRGPPAWDELNLRVWAPRATETTRSPPALFRGLRRLRQPQGPFVWPRETGRDPHPPSLHNPQTVGRPLPLDPLSPPKPPRRPSPSSPGHSVSARPTCAIGVAGFAATWAVP
jgi:hypothetical protein